MRLFTPSLFIISFITGACGAEVSESRAAQETPSLSSHDRADTTEHNKTEPSNEISEPGIDVGLIAKARPVPAQCVISYLKGFELNGSSRQGTLGFMACRPRVSGTLDTEFLTGTYDVVTYDYLGPKSRLNMAEVSVYIDGESLLAPNQTGVVGSLMIKSINSEESHEIIGNIEFNTPAGLVTKSFSAWLLGQYLNTATFASPVREGRGL